MRPKGNAFLRWTYARTVQLLAHWDGLGPDGRPSFSKNAVIFGFGFAFAYGNATVLIVSLCGAFGPKMLLAAIKSWRGVTADIRATVRQERDVTLGIDPA